MLLPWSSDDVALLADLGADRRVVRYVGLGQPWPAARAIEVSDACVRHWHDHGFGWRTIVSKRTGAKVGLLALNFLADGAVGVSADAHEIGWWLHPDHWGIGYATEAARAVADDSFQRLRFPELTARIQKPNRASIAVARSLGMTHLLDTTGRFGEPCAVYRVQRPDLRAADG